MNVLARRVTSFRHEHFTLYMTRVQSPGSPMASMSVRFASLYVAASHSVPALCLTHAFTNPGRLGVLGSGRFSKREFFLQKCSVGLVTAIGHWNFLAVRISDIYGPRTRRLQTEVLGQIFIVLKYAHRWHCS